MAWRTFLMASAAITGSIVGTPSLAANAAGDRVTQVGELVVTAEKRSENILKVPQSIAALSGKKLEDLGLYDVQDYSTHVPDLQVTAPVPGTTKTTIRGLSSESNTSTVGVYINETPVTQNELDPDMKLFDVARIEVLRGPQGTLYGEGSLGGTVRIITNAPSTQHFESAIEGRLSNFSNSNSVNYALNGMVNIPLTDTLAVRAVLGYIDNQPWITNLGTGHSENFEHALTGRLAAKWQVTPAFDITGTYIYQKDDLGSPRAVIDPTLSGYQRSTKVDESDADRLQIGSLTWNYNFGFATLTSDTSYYHRTQHTVGNNSQTGGVQFFYDEINGAAAGFPAFSQFQNPPGFPFLTVPESVVDFLGTTSSWSEEARLVSNPNGGPIDWIVGVFFQDRHDIKDTYFSGLIDGTPLFDFSQFNVLRSRTKISDYYKQIAGFGELTWHVTSQIDFTAGVRYSSERVIHQENLDGTFQYNFGTFPPTTTPVQFGPSAKTFNSVTPRFVLTWRPSQNWTTYASVSRGFRAGGFVGTVAYLPDTVWDYEVGAKGLFWDGKANIASAIYYIDWKNVQAQVDTPNPPFFAFLNVGDAVSKGIETELTLRPIEGLELFGGLNLINAHVTRVDPNAVANNAGLIAGNKMQKVPDWTLNITGTYRWPVLKNGMYAMVQGNLFHSDSAFSDFRNLPDEELPAYTTLGLRVGLEKEPWGAYIFVKNLTDARIPLEIQSPTDPNANVIGEFVGRPREVGLEIRAHF